MQPKIHTRHRRVASFYVGCFLLTAYHSQATIHTAQDSCLTIVLQNGDTVQAKKIKIFDEKVRYSRCEDADGQEFIYQKRADVISVEGHNVNELVLNKARREKQKEALLKAREQQKEKLKQQKQNTGLSFFGAVLAICLIVLCLIAIQALKNLEEGLKNITFDWDGF